MVNRLWLKDLQPQASGMIEIEVLRLISCSLIQCRINSNSYEMGGVFLG